MGFGDVYKRQSSKITPLWIVATFVTLTEAVLGYAITKTEGGVQIALTVFVICFALLVFAAFFVVLWVKPYVFYPPSEYTDGDPKKFVDAMTPTQNVVADQIQLAQKAADEPSNREAMFGVMDSLIDDVHRQLLILMHEEGKELPFVNFFGAGYELSRLSGEWSGGGLNTQEFAKKLNGTDLVTIVASGPSVALTQQGHEFSRWMLEQGRRSDFFATPYGGWGERRLPDGMPPEWTERHPFAPVPTATANKKTPDTGASSENAETGKGENEHDTTT